MKKRIAGFVIWMLGCAGAAQAVSNFAGEWSYQALNAGDTNFKVEQDGKQITFYRVLHPEFEGERYKLEHMYRGVIDGNTIEGKLFVREEGMQDFEFLRPFGGTIQRDDRMIIDELPLKRVNPPMAAEPPAAPAEPPRQGRYSKVVIKREKQKAPAAIPKLIPVANRIKTDLGRKVEALLKQGDDLFAAKHYLEAVERYAAAQKLDPHKVELLYKLGHGHGTLGVLQARQGKSARAREHYQKAIAFWQQAIRYDPYNQGAKENIRRAEKKLAGLSR